MKFFSCFANQLGKALGKPVAQPGDLLVFQEHDGSSQGVVVVGEAAGPLEGIEICTAEAAKFRSLLNLRRKLKRPSAA